MSSKGRLFTICDRGIVRIAAECHARIWHQAGVCIGTPAAKKNRKKGCLNRILSEKIGPDKGLRLDQPPISGHGQFLLGSGFWLSLVAAQTFDRLAQGLEGNMQAGKHQDPPDGRCQHPAKDRRAERSLCGPPVPAAVTSGSNHRMNLNEGIITARSRSSRLRWLRQRCFCQ